MSSAPWFKAAMSSPCCGARLHKSGIQNEQQRYRCTCCGAKHTEANLFPERKATSKTVPSRTPPEFKPLKRDPFAHARLAVVGR